MSISKMPIVYLCESPSCWVHLVAYEIFCGTPGLVGVSIHTMLVGVPRSRVFVEPLVILVLIL